MAKQKRVQSRGAGWVSGWVATRCPSTDPKRLLALQRVSFPSLTAPCQPGASCTACMCRLSSAMGVASSAPEDLPLCIRSFRTVLMFPAALGGAGLSPAAYTRLQQCAPADPPCADQKAGAVFGSLGPAVVPSAPGADLSCLSGKTERACATACVAAAGCAGFLYTVQGSSGAGWLRALGEGACITWGAACN